MVQIVGKKNLSINILNTYTAVSAQTEAFLLKEQQMHASQCIWRSVHLKASRATVLFCRDLSFAGFTLAGKLSDFKEGPSSSDCPKEGGWVAQHPLRMQKEKYLTLNTQFYSA